MTERRGGRRGIPFAGAALVVGAMLAGCGAEPASFDEPLGQAQPASMAPTTRAAPAKGMPRRPPRRSVTTR
ncbi:MAG: hypothetical protein JRI68_27910 [Deltaproteobacteria bacterium]|nr:hypothetical protein [Deltaproteobacteria bacterium]